MGWELGQKEGPVGPGVGAGEPSTGSFGGEGKRKEMLAPRLWPWGTAQAHDWASLALIQESPDDDEAASDQENVDPNL